MRLFIAEKPELAKAIVEGLGGGQKRGSYYECGTDRVTWCFGHMLQLLDPEDYDKRYEKWSLDDLPIAHIPWRKKPAPDKKDQLNAILGLLKEASAVVHAGDPDEEGQLLVDEILEYANCRLPVKRVLINDNNTAVVKKALASLRDNRDFAGLSAAAEARSVGDQLYGYNLTRAYTLVARQAGYQGLLSVGRVQTPILGLVVRRCRENSAHVKAYYYLVTGNFTFGEVTFPARYQPAQDDQLDDKGRLADKAQADAIADAVRGKPAQLLAAETKKKTEPPPLPYNLLKLQTDASKKYGMKPDKVKDITQVLRERHKLITYNRSDCEYLSDEQHADAPGVLAAISDNAGALAPLVQRADPSIKSRAFNSSKVSAHHAIIPTQGRTKVESLTDDERKIYLLIARAYIAQFWPHHEYDRTELLVDVEGKRFACAANLTTQPGWTVLYRNEADENDDPEDADAPLKADLRTLRTSQGGQCTTATADQKETKPRPLYTMATLLADLTRVAKYVRDDRLRKALIEKDKGKEGEHGGIGTPATRDTIIATLFERGYLVEKDKKVIATPTGFDLYDTLPDQAKYPDMTALWHEQQRAIQAGERDTVSFINELMEYIGREVKGVKANGLQLRIEVHPCPNCKRPLRRIQGKQGFFWGCTGFQEGCKFSTEDKGGKPVARQAPTVSELHKCMSCGKGLVRRPSTKRKGIFWWGCSGYPGCTQTYLEANGKPDYSTSTSTSTSTKKEQ